MFIVNTSTNLNEFWMVPSDISESRVIVTFLEVQPVKGTSQNMYFGMLSTSNQQSTEEDFKIAEAL
ncbi:MAG: hypothetical protein KME29_07755 [Calothrix sp. FI2-JRJ7]|nr:hypothetical protein [Calothrix sp. FI2-JRJ7]